MTNRALTDPFAMMMDPQAVLAAVQSSERLQQLQSKIHRPLDKPLLPRSGADAADYDHDIDLEPTAFGEMH
jgi:hypothetical protein